MAQQWTRVTGPDLDQGKDARALRNAGVLASKTFTDACEKAGIPPTLRQASRFSRKRGLAYQSR